MCCSLSVWRPYLVIFKSAEKRYVMRMCISWLCRCKGKNISCISRIYPSFISYSTSATTTLNFLPSIPLGVDKLCLFCRILSNITTPGLVNWLHVPIYGQEKQTCDVKENDNKNSQNAKLFAWENSRHFTTGFPDNERRNSLLMTRHYPDLGGASDWLK